jgi:meso-butanediol dehydrogenase/(S,S)-butanediol dehydrogenase/diacetyl reductase
VQRLVDQVAIVTGGGLGIGGATARRLAEEGAAVLVVDVNQEAASNNAERIRTAGGSAEALVADVGTVDGVRSMVERAVERFGKLNVLVNNAFGWNATGNAEAVSDDGWDRAFDIGLKSMYRSAKLAVPHLRAAGAGSIVNISSVHGLLAAPGALVYETLKAGVIGLTRQLAVEYGPDGIRVNAICPGHIVTERIQQLWQANPAGLRFFEQQYPLRRTGTPLDIANAIVFLCSDEAAFVTGQALVVDGGLSIQLQEDLSVRLARYALDHPETVAPRQAG